MNCRQCFVLLLGAALGFAVATLTSGPTEGIPGFFPSLKLVFSGITMHVHHWLWAGSSAATMLVLHKRKRFQFSSSWRYVALGLLIGIMVQGLRYDDWYRVVWLH